MHKLKIGLALGSGGAKGLAHIGVIKTLIKNNIPIDFIAGSSIGSMVGGAYAVLKDIKKVEKIALDTNWKQILSFLDPSFGQGLIKGEKIKNFMESHIGKVHFKDLKIPFSVMATNLKTGKAVLINKGKVASAIRASISYPLVFKPVKRENELLTDGGLSCPVPVEIVKKMGADLVIAVNLDANYFTNNQNKTFGFYNIASNSINLLRYHLSCWNIKNADIVITPKNGYVGWNKFLDGKNIILSGEKAMKSAMPQLKKLLKSKNCH